MTNVVLKKFTDGDIIINKKDGNLYKLFDSVTYSATIEDNELVLGEAYDMTDEYAENCVLVLNQDYTESIFYVALGTGLAWIQPYVCFARNEQEAINIVADYCVDHDLLGLFSDHYTIADEIEDERTVKQYAEDNGLICCGNNGVYMQIVGITEIKEGIKCLH